MKPLVLTGRLVFGAWMLANGVNHFFVSLYPEPTGHTPLAIQLMTALVHSHLLGVVMAIELVAGALILANVLVPLALCVLMPLSVCALFWSLILDHQPFGALLALLAFALNGLLMLAYIDYYSGALQRYATPIGDSAALRYEALYANPTGRTSRSHFVRALVTLLAVAAFYFFLVKGRNGEWVLITLLFPAAVLHARRLHDMGLTAWLLLIPGALVVVALWMHMYGHSSALEPTVNLAALVVCAAFVLWGLLGKGQPQGNRFGDPVAV